MQNINPIQTRNRRAMFYLWILGLPLFFGGLIALTLLALFTQFPALGNWTWLGMLLLGLFGVPAVIGGIIAVYRGVTLDKDNQLAYQVGEMLKHSLDDKFTFIRNVSRRKLGYIDAVLVGPPGALVFRIVDYKGVWRNEVVEWTYRDNKGKMRAASNNPTRECARDVYALRDYLADRDLADVPVYGIVVFHAQGITLQPESPVIPVTETQYLFQIMQRDYLAEQQRISAQQGHDTIKAITG